jgi:hypothetical protein
MMARKEIGQDVRIRGAPGEEHQEAGSVATVSVVESCTD